ncbi:hypothetical protein, partial [Bifidobacterium sp.]|uniref:hypothetical protein n=1 Tax=Bifidobacterium sp. TaxID=41200 RepID=UPI003D7DE45E
FEKLSGVRSRFFAISGIITCELKLSGVGSSFGTGREIRKKRERETVEREQRSAAADGTYM